VVNHFIPLGYAVYSLDQIGHGRSAGERVLVRDFSDFTITLKKYLDLIDIWQPETPIFLIGHSMGGLIVPSYLVDYQDELSGAIISAPFVKIPDYLNALTVIGGRILSLIFPKAGLVGVDAEGVSKDPAVVEAYENDPLVYRGKTSARLGAEMLKEMDRLKRHGSRINLPILTLQGKEDRLVDPSGASYLNYLVGSKDKVLKEYNGLHHEIFNEPEREMVFKDVEVWLEAHLV
jgi:alpha-beta hydrolase superfamily lysophospholipase